MNYFLCWGAQRILRHPYGKARNILGGKRNELMLASHQGIKRAEEGLRNQGHLHLC